MDYYIASSTSPTLLGGGVNLSFDVKQTTDFSDYGSGFAVFMTMILLEYKWIVSEVYTEFDRSSDKGFLASELKFRPYIIIVLVLKGNALNVAV